MEEREWDKKNHPEPPAKVLVSRTEGHTLVGVQYLQSQQRQEKFEEEVPAQC